MLFRSQEAKPYKWQIKRGWDGVTRKIWFSDGKDEQPFDADFIDFINKNYKDVTFRFSPQTIEGKTNYILNIFQDERIGILMPLRK